MTLAPRRPARSLGKGSQAAMLALLASGLLWGGLGSRLVTLQLIRSTYNRQLADNNRVRIIPQPPERGRILDRQGRLLAGSQLSHGVFLWPLAQPQADWQPVIRQLAQATGLNAADITTRIEQVGYNSPFPVRIVRNATPEVITRLEETILPGVIVQPEAVRYYPNGEAAAHVLGYTGEIPPEGLTEEYRLGDIIGRVGVEEAYEDRLRGQWGGQQVEVDVRGEVIRVLGEQPARIGQTLTLTLDLNLQQVAEAALGQRLGAVVAIDPRDGAVRAMASYPRFDPNIFSSAISQAQWDELQALEFPFLNRGIRPFPPASTFKIVTTAAGIESGAFGLNTVLMTTAYTSVGGHLFWDWNRVGFGALGWTGAMAFSSDTFFYQVALRTGAEPIRDWSRRFSIGQPTGLEISGESGGLVPTEDWKLTHFNEYWYPGDTVNMSIGQGFMLATPLQVAVMTAIVANGGWRVQPHLVTPPEPHPRTWIGLSPGTIQILQQGLREVLTYGTGSGLVLPPEYPAIAGKSGTAEDPPRRSHAWFTAYGPYDNPELVVVAFLENSGGGGSSQAGPITTAVLQAYFDGQ